MRTWVVKVDFPELTALECCPKTVYPASVDIFLIFIARPIDLVKITGGKPGRP